MKIYLIENAFHNQTYIIAKDLETAVELFYKFVDDLKMDDIESQKDIENIKFIGYVNKKCIERE